MASPVKPSPFTERPVAMAFFACGLAALSLASVAFAPMTTLAGEPPSSERPNTSSTRGGVEGRVRTSVDDGVVPSVEITLIDADGISYATTTDESGAFGFDLLAPGRYELWAESDALGSGHTTVVVEAGEIAELELELESDAAVVITVNVSTPEQREESAEAVQVIDTTTAKQQSADLGEVLARSQGVGVRRSGGLGSDTRFSLNGLTDDQIRFFLDGLPLELSGYPFGISNVPVNLVDRVDVFRGVVPIRYGADALGGAVDLVTDDHSEGTHGSVSYQVGSFNTHRVTGSLGFLHEPSGFVARGAGYFDDSRNNYAIDVEVTDEMGRLSNARVKRFHDAYRAAGGSLELGVVDRPWAERLLVRGFVSDNRKQLQHNVVMTVPYGDVHFGTLSAGGSVRYQQVFAHQLRLGVVAGYVYAASDFVDTGECVYNWFGQCILEQTEPGELGPFARDQTLWDHNVFGRVNLEWRPNASHGLRLSVSPTYTTRTGEQRLLPSPDARDPLTAQRDLLTLVSGVEYELDVDDRFQNLLFFKYYVQLARAEDPVTPEEFVRRDRDSHRVGFGDSLRLRFLPWLYAKVSYEWATRLPRAAEIFGNGVLIEPNLELQPEISHNVNVGLTADAKQTRAGAWRAGLDGFLRDADQLIVLIGSDRFFSYENVFSARSLGFEASAGWTSPGDYVVLDGNLTYLDFRNTSSEGTFDEFEGDRLPNRPYLFANATARLQFRRVVITRDELALEWNTRYVHGFFRSWESIGLEESKLVIPAQLLHAIALTYLMRFEPIAVNLAAELQNLTNQAAFDFFGVQRPGRAAYFKVSLEF